MTTSLLGISDGGANVSLPQADRRQGTYVIGATGTGKSTLLENLIIQDITQGLGVGLLDPHGDLVDRIIERLPLQRVQDVILLDIGNTDYVFGLNLYEVHASDIRAVQTRVEQVMHIFDLLYEVSRTTPLMAQTLRNASYTLIANGFTFAEVPMLLTNPSFRRRVLQRVTLRHVLDYWRDFEQKNKLDRDREIAATLNKFDELLQPLTLNIVAQGKSTLSLGDIMDERKILLVKLDARMPYVTSLVGSLLVAKVLNAAYDRQQMLPKHRKQFNLYADEFQRFATPDFALMLTEARKYGIAVTIAHQTLQQISIQNKSAAMQAANKIIFRVPEDAKELASLFDVTPQAAWEEEIEEEWVEVLKEEWEEEIEPEWHERVEEEITDGAESLLIPKRDIITHLLAHGHPNAKVTEFVTKYLQFEGIS